MFSRHWTTTSGGLLSREEGNKQSESTSVPDYRVEEVCRWQGREEEAQQRPGVLPSWGDCSLGRPRWLETVGQRIEEEGATHRERKISEALQRSPLTSLKQKWSVHGWEGTIQGWGNNQQTWVGIIISEIHRARNSSCSYQRRETSWHMGPQAESSKGHCLWSGAKLDLD